MPAPQDPNLLVGSAGADDAAVYRLPGGEAVVQTVDFFTPVVDDPYLFGQIAAANALSDIYAMGARPFLALALAAFPTEVLSMEILERILRGGVDKVTEAGAVVGGGHSIDHDVPIYGLAASGLVDPAHIVRNIGTKPGDRLVLTKSLGVGVIVAAARVDSLAASGIGALFHRPKASEAVLDGAVRTMTALNRAAAEAMTEFPVHAATDVTGYGLLGHAFEMMRGSGTTAVIDFERLPLLPGARELAERGIAPDGSRKNFRNLKEQVKRTGRVNDTDFLLVCDAQTSGGLLVALPFEAAAAYAERCRSLGAADAAVVGEVVARAEQPLELRRN
jgi:selenide, water dikinase